MKIYSYELGNYNIMIFSPFGSICLLIIENTSKNLTKQMMKLFAVIMGDYWITSGFWEIMTGHRWLKEISTNGKQAVIWQKTNRTSPIIPKSTKMKIPFIQIRKL